MKTLLLLILICGSLNAQKLVKVVYFPPSSLEDINQEFLRMVDSTNINKLKRLTYLDSAAAYHARYLYERNKAALGGSDNRIYLSHYETEDLDNFTEKLNPKDRTGHPMTYEICYNSNVVGTKYLNSRSKTLVEMIENQKNALELLNYLGNRFYASEIYSWYKSSPGHYAVITSKDVGYFGATTMLFGAARFYESDREADSMEYIFYEVNVTVFFNKAVSESEIDSLRKMHSHHY
jgi:hypothetical protein